MNEYLVSARKYRPVNLIDVVGQNHITTTLKNAIDNNQIAHAYLFCGPRGVGKTTCARIFATLVNNNNHSEYNIFELDGASNNSVDDIRNLIDQVKIPPQIGKYKVYIIDEVHMLSKSAFNAFLKTLEEPPKHSIFILATTEKEKIIPTILSRCQIFDFHRINNSEMITHLNKILTKENITAEENSLKLIAEKADGSLRDALSIFDRVYTFCNSTWEHQEVAKILLSLDTSFSIQLVDLIIKKDIANCLLLVNDIINKGFAGKEIIKVLITHFRNLIIAKNNKTITLIQEKKELISKIETQAKDFTTEHILLALSCLNECDRNYEKSIHQQFLVELCIMKLCSMQEFDVKKKILIHPIEKFKSKNKHSNLISQQIEERNQPQENLESDNIHAKKEINIDSTNNIESNKINPQLEEKNQPEENLESNNINEKKEINIDSKLISITEELASMQKNTKTNSGEKKNKEWEEKKLILYWKEFSLQLKLQEKTNLHNIFERYVPTKNNNELNLEVVSLSEKSEIDEMKSDLLTFLKDKLENDFISLVIKISDEKKNMLFTKKGKYEYVLKKNEQIKLLQEKLNLNII
ncbi:MAG: DNA polymerase III, subunit gamma and tau [Flavobacteriales bacterium]|nr:DNA polymerase III, subunit gamma and tau [Flavobacteriales bacterium]